MKLKLIDKTWFVKLKDWENNCGICGQKFKKGDWVRLHTKPKLDGGKTEFTGKIFCWNCEEKFYNSPKNGWEKGWYGHIGRKAKFEGIEED